MADFHDLPVRADGLNRWWMTSEPFVQMEGSLRPEPRRWRMSHGWTFLSCRLSDETVPVPGCPRLSSFPVSAQRWQQAGVFGSGPSHRQHRPGYMSEARTSSSAAFKDTVRKRSNARAEAARLRPRARSSCPSNSERCGRHDGGSGPLPETDSQQNSQQCWLLIKSVRPQNYSR